MTNDIGFAKIQQIATRVDAKGNGNHIIDTTSETSLFSQELEKAGVEDAKKIIADYKSNPLKYESVFAMNTETKKDSDTNAIISFLNANSHVRRDDSADENNQILSDIKDSVEYASCENNISGAVAGAGIGYLIGSVPGAIIGGIIGGFAGQLGWGTNETKLEAAVSRIDKDNVLQVLNTKYKDNETMLKAIVGDVNQKDMNKLGAIIINALVEKAKDFNIDVSDIVQEVESSNLNTNPEDKKFIVGSDVEGVDYGKSATDKLHVEKIINALNERITSELKILSGKFNSENGKQNNASMILAFAKQADTDRNGLNDIDEIVQFKKLCGKAGILVNNMKQVMKYKDKKDFTDEEKTLEMVLSSDFGTISTVEREKKNAVAAVASGIKNKDNDLVSSVINADTINADTVEEFLTSLENNKNFMALSTGRKVSGYQTTSAGITVEVYANEYSDKNDIGKKLTSAFGDKARKYTEVIVSALYKKAGDENIDVSDIVTFSNDKYITRSAIGETGKDALDTRYVNDVINKLRERIAEYQ